MFFINTYTQTHTHTHSPKWKKKRWGRREKRGIRAPLIHSRTIVLSAETAKRPGSDYGRQSNGPSRMKMPIS